MQLTTLPTADAPGILRLHDDLHWHTHDDEARDALAQSIWRQETVELLTVGIDIGSSTSHLIFSKVLLQRKAQELSSRFVVVRREVIWRSPIMLTPFISDESIDAKALEQFIRDCYQEAGLKREDVDSGAVILTGEAIKRSNARAIDELFAEEAGKFVCATAGHRLESMLAAHGSGAVQLSKRRDATVLHVDIGGGTTKLALIERGKIRDVAAFAVGGRLLATDAAGGWTRIDEAARLAGEDLGLDLDPATVADPAVRERIARRLAEILCDHVAAAPLDRLGMALQLTESLQRASEPTLLTFSGGVSEYLMDHESSQFGDIAMPLATAIRELLPPRIGLPVINPGQGIRATVIGASQFTVQVSGKTIFMSDGCRLPVHNLPVVHPSVALGEEIDAAAVTEAIRERLATQDLRHDAPIAIALHWHGDPSYQRLAALGEGIRAAVEPGKRREAMLVVVVDGDVGGVLGHVLKNEVGLAGELISLDGISLEEFDYIDIGTLIEPPGVVPVVIKSLLFS